MARILNTLIIAVLLSALKCTDVYACLNDNPCLCEIDEYNKIDLTQVSQGLKTDEFLEDKDALGNSFYFHGCKDGNFNATEHKFNVTDPKKVYPGSFIWVNTTIVKDGNVTYVVNGVKTAKSSQIKFVPVEGQKDSYQIVYKNEENITAKFTLLCTKLGPPFIKIFSVTGTDPLLGLGSPYACVITSHPGLSTGSVLLLIFFISLGIYFFGGCLVLYFIRGARGLELIPNIDFWRRLPGLVKDGVIFLFSGCNTSSITTSETYDRI